MFLPDVIVSAEVPVEMNAFKSQQHRWAKGSIQTCRKLLPQILRARFPEREGRGVLPFDRQLQLSVDVGAVGPDVPVDGDPLQHGVVRDAPHRHTALLRGHAFGLELLHRLSARTAPRLGVATQVPAVPDVDWHWSVRQQHTGGYRSADWEADRVRPNPQVLHRAGERRVGGKKYRQTVAIQPIVEMALGLHFTATVFYALANGIYGTLPFLILFQVGFLYTGLLSIVQQFAGDDLVLGTQVAK